MTSIPKISREWRRELHGLIILGLINLLLWIIYSDKSTDRQFRTLDMYSYNNLKVCCQECIQRNGSFHFVDNNFETLAWFLL